MKFKCFITLLSMFLIGTSALAEKVDLKKELDAKPTQTNPATVKSYNDEYGATITEYKTAGKTWMIKVQPAGDFPAYYLYDNEGNGTFERRLSGNKKPSPPMWIIKRF